MASHDAQRVIKFRAYEEGVMHYSDDHFDLEAFFAAYPFEETTAHMQFTGLHDKNGKEIYEGDLLKRTPPNVNFHSGPIEVRWDDYCCAFLFIEGKLDRTAPHTDFKYIEVIGNIYEHGHLIGKYPDSFTSEEEAETDERV
jgi:uncharacterized phage protein (TIGR01671 family)